MDSGEYACYISVAGNLSPEDNIPRALVLLERKCPLHGISTFYRTEAINRPEQPQYLNGVVSLEYSGDPKVLKYQVLRKIEDALGRVRTDDSYAARPIDLDVLIFGSLVINEPDLVLPDPDILTRPFLAAALSDLCPGLTLPGRTIRIQEILTTEQRRSLIPDMPFTEALRERFLK